jgi:hypothetical protein
LELLDTQTLLHCDSTDPRINVKAGKSGRPLGREGIDALSRDPIDVVIEACPWIRFIQWIQTLAGFVVANAWWPPASPPY